MKTQNNFRQRVEEFDDPEKAYSDFVERQKMKRLGTADEIAGAVLFLASPEVATFKYFCTKYNFYKSINFIGWIYDWHQHDHGWWMVTLKNPIFFFNNEEHIYRKYIIWILNQILSSMRHSLKVASTPKSWPL